ncbi:type IV pilin-like G/H family protein [Aulosira sp. FACHB-615]|uniref:type IV pilin-like G/H family protein n=1 Tax=Aulosira sp. FACHB-615 TaxID=2692777 RepID=UPI001685CE78|nr:type IV pilin-like G/H family protein [Aulosira sp. FACHB-615]MBD2489055.1 hypothetical protein [Aulosira sp. FACHB-615]
MKLSVLGLLSSLSFIFCFTTTSKVIANTVTDKQNQQISAQELDLKKQILFRLGSVGRAQQAYFLEQQVFATQIKQLELDSNFETSIPGYKWQIFTDKKAKKVAMTVLSPQKNNSRTYVNFVMFTITDGNEYLTLSTLCESEKNQLIIPKLPTKFPKNQGIECPSGFRKLELSDRENQTFEQLEKEKEQRFIVSLLNSLQQQYYSQNQGFTNDIDRLFGFSVNKFISNQDLKIKLLPINNLQNGIISIALLPSQAQKSYLGIVRRNQSQIEQPKAIICELPEKAALNLEKLKNLPLNNFLDCPQNFTPVSLSPEETTTLNQELENFKTYHAKIIEINQPRKTQILQTADQLAKEGKYLDALQKYYLALGALEINEYDILSVMTEEVSFNPIVDNFFKKITPVLQAAKPSLLAEKKAIKSEMSGVFDSFSVKANSPARKIQEIAAWQLGFNLLTVPSQEFKVPENKVLAFVDVADLLQKQFNDKSQVLNHNLDKKLRSYVNKNKTAIATIRNLLLNNEVPRWGIDYKWIKEGDFQAPSPSYIGVVNLQRLLIIDILDKQQQGNNQEMLKSLEASWKLSESLKDEPSLIGQLVNIIIRRSQLRVLEKIDNLPVVWQQRLLEKDYTQAMIQALNIEAFSQWQGLDKIIPPEKDTQLSQLYRDWYGINNFKINQEFYRAIAQRKNNLCSLNIQALEKQYFPQNATISPSYVKQILKAHDLMLESEMLQKVLQVKAAIHPGKALPRELSEMPSNICSGNKWLYKSAADGKWLIYLDKPPIWQSEIERPSLTYTGKFNGR